MINKIKDIYKKNKGELLHLSYVGTMMAFIFVSGFVIPDYNTMDNSAEVVAKTMNNEAPTIQYRPMPKPIVIEKEVIVEKEVVVEKECTLEHVEEVVEDTAVQDLASTEANTNAVNIQEITPYFDVFQPSNFTVEQISQSLDSGSHQGLLHLAPVFVEAEQTYGVNSLYLMSTIGYESGWGKYRSGTNNLGGWKSSTTGTWRNFDSEYECIMTIAEGLATSFKPDVGNYLIDVTGRYCPEPQYLSDIMQIMKEQLSKIEY